MMMPLRRVERHKITACHFILSAMLLFGILCIIFAIANADQIEDRSVIVNVMIDCELNPTPHNWTIQEEKAQELDSFTKMLNIMDSRKLNTSIFFTGEFASKKIGDISCKDYIALVASNKNHEIALHSMKTADKLGAMSYEEQLALLASAKALIEDAYKAERSTPIIGFRPQYFNQSEVTYKVLDKLGIVHDSGFQAGLLYAPGHQNDTWPYQLEDHLSYAVPISTYHMGKRAIYACDMSCCRVDKLNGSQWHDYLVSAFKDCKEKDEPMVVIFHNFISGEDPMYMEAFEKFIEFAVSKNATFVSTNELVELTKTK
jgi:peptidoglycan/xylan/chitin deacetylase (PgdA/CDA1 family)